MPIDNFALLRRFVPEYDDGDTFVYTEILDRSKRAGRNQGRRKATFFHRSLEDYDRHRARIIKACNLYDARAYLRPAKRSFKKVGKLFFTKMTEQVLADNWQGMRHGYASACGKSNIEKIWLFDFDTYEKGALYDLLVARGALEVPSKKGFHMLIKPFDRRLFLDMLDKDVSVHYDNPTNLYIPED